MQKILAAEGWYDARVTTRVDLGTMVIVLPWHNPVRVAEDIAMLDHMTGGRANAGFARGYQRRWVDIMAQQTHGIHGALPNRTITRWPISNGASPSDRMHSTTWSSLAAARTSGKARALCTSRLS